MEFTNTFTVQAPLDEVWDFLLDAQEVAPCVPGATLTESVDAQHHKGTVKVKLGAVQMSYRGELEMLPDKSTSTIVLRARGTEQRGSGGASGTFTTHLSEESGSTTVEIQTKVDVTGRVAQFGRGIMQDVAYRMIKDFASCLETKLQARGQAPQQTDGAVPPAATQPTPSTQAAETTTAGPAPSPPRSYSPAPPTADARPAVVHRPAAENELRLAPLIGDLLRSRTAAALRAIASRIEPK
jgi:carbon monoxide dehydrogenase subunit G